MNDDKFHIPARKKSKQEGSSVVRLSEEAYNMLIDLYNDSTSSMSQIASSAIIFAAERAVFDKEGV